MENKIKYIHFVGIGGSGMSGIAEIMHNMNFVVSGSDPNQSSVIEHLRKRGILIFSKHEEKNIQKVDVVVTSTAIPKNNPEIVAAKKQNIPIIPRAEMLSELMRFKEGIAIAGTHGKTSTTSILATIMNDAGLDPTYVIGGRINSLRQSARLGKSKYMIVEADESDASFLHLNPSNVLVTNIDNDHMETYGHDEERLKQTFVDFIHQIPFYNEVFLCIDDKNIKSIQKLIARPIITFGFSKKADYYPDRVVIKKNKSLFRVNSISKKMRSFSVEIDMPGRHYILNTLGAIAIALSLNIKPQVINKALKKFKGVSRRFDLYEEFRLGEKNINLIDDYGHHPTEIKAVLDSIKKGFPGKKINLVFQPHRYSRTKDLFEQFVQILATVDRLFLFEIYAAGEQAIEGISSHELIKNIKNEKYILYDMAKAPILIEDKIKDDEILLVMGAGSVGNWVQHQLLGDSDE